MYDYVDNLNWDLSISQCVEVRDATLGSIGGQDTWYWFDPSSSRTDDGWHDHNPEPVLGISRDYAPGNEMHDSLPPLIAHEGAHHAGYDEDETGLYSLEGCVRD